MKQLLTLLITLLIIKAEAQSSASSVADSLYLVGDYSAAINAYSALGDENASLHIARAYNAIGNKEKAILQYKNLLLKNKKHTLASFELGKIYDNTKRYDEAIKVFKALTIDSENPNFFYYLGKSLLSNLDYDSAISTLKKAVALDSTHLRSIYLLGKYYVRVEEPSNATKIIELGLKTAPNDVALINLKALTKFDVGEYDIAAPLFERLLDLGEKKPFVYKKLGHSLANINEFKKAKNTYRQLEKISNYEPDAYKGLAEVYVLEQKLDSAEVYYLKSIEERRYIFDEEYGNLGRIAKSQGKLKKSLDYFTKAWQENKLNPLSHWQVCIIADEYYKDPKVKLQHYEKLLSDFDNLYPFLKERALKRVKELKEEIHFSKE